MDKDRSQLFLDAKPIRKIIFLKRDKKVWFYNEDLHMYDVAMVYDWNDEWVVTLYKPRTNSTWKIPVYKLFLTEPNESTWNDRMESVGIYQLKF